MPRKQTKKEESQELDTSSVVGLETHTGQVIVLEYNPSEDVVKEFVSIQNAKYKAGQAGNQSSSVVFNPAFLIKSAARYPNYTDAVNNENRGEEIDITGL